LELASIYNLPLVVDALIKKGAKLNATGTDGETAVCWTAIHGHIDCLVLLVGAGADVN